ncbi:MAG: universal stress protein [Rhizobiales bacterium]|nr:universal stress protein [Hyphomicrobiales bacterium]
MIMRDILVHLKSHEEWSPHIDYAIGVAAGFGARLRGYMTFADISFLRSISGTDETAVARQKRRDQKIAAAMQDRLLAAASAQDVACEFVTGEGPASELVTRAARLHDLTIIEQHDPGRDEFGFDPAEEAALSAGRPIVLVPKTGRFQPAPRHILVAWNGSAQAATALQFALPFIERAEKITLCVGKSRETPRRSSREPDLSIAGYLQDRVGQVETVPVDVNGDHVGAFLLEQANEAGAEMIVMGAYGRSRFSEVILGGATRHIIQKMTLPILMGR